MRMDVGILGGTVVTPAAMFRKNVYVKGGAIAALTSERLSARQAIDASGLYVLPGMVDSHVHFMDPGETHREDFVTGSTAAAVGGTTTVIEHTHASPVIDAISFREKAAHLEHRSLVDFGLAAHVLHDRIRLAREAWKAGALYLKVFTCTTHGITGLSSSELLQLLREVAAFDGVCLIHCEDELITADAERQLRKSGRTDFGIVPLWRSREAELVAVNTVALLARLTGVRVVIAHASHEAVIALAARERKLGARIWVESCPQYFYIEEEEVMQHGPFRKFTPPARLRSEGDLEAMWRRLRGGDIAYIATDHAPATRAQKQAGNIWEAPFGLPGVETTLSLLLNATSEDRLTLPRLVEAVCEAPARLYGLFPRKGSLQEGADADLTLVDLSQGRTLRDDDIHSKAGWTPYAGRHVRGQPVMTFVRGRLVARDGKPLGEPGWGRLVGRSQTDRSPV
jgi:dihydroorotase (multifunctional complex type)